ncbi:family 10 glycosylhydrolase [Chitinophaga sp. GCM10012297]|uniref:Family 10 glycosylhydrolase n=1 Tax=Chitinophaga chungangae TaxID=2821488 RepID=A0ABS3YBB9_9BACT|nr:family 10 glycosylhydrolase [Chitinophaga chungangae]MBO9151968.1 family 10 glycosylhydrolase [Chitinophaga chungangae]
MPRFLPVLLLCSLLPAAVSAQKNLKRELRGAWVATFTGIDWPNRTQTPAQQRAAFITIANYHKATGMNALFVQMRSQCDAMYPSDIEPWSADLTGKQGTAPSTPWDPMAFAIEECHKRGMEFHAWLNPYRAASNSANIPGFAENHVTKTHPEWLLSQGVLRVLDPGLPEVRDHIMNVIADIVTRYDVDGIHFDDYFYPPAAPAGTTPYNDDSTFAAYPRGFTVKADWRRDNVNLLIQRVYDSIRTIKPWVKFGVSPSGIYRNSTNPAIGTPTSGLEHYTTLFADTRRWLQEGWVDYIMPQVYWWIGQPGANYGAIVPWWNSQAAGRHIYIGIAGYKVGDAAQAAAWQDSTQVPRQLRMNRDSLYPNIFGQSIYNTNSLRSNRKNFRDSLRLRMYAKPALLPQMRWRDSIAPPAPETVNATPDGQNVQLSWQHSGDAADQMNRARQFVVYRSENPVINTDEAANILAVTDTAVFSFTDTSALPATTYYYTVTALDRFHNESILSNLSANLPPEILCPGDQQLTGNADCSAIIPDYRSLVIISNPAGVNVLQYPAPGSRVGGNSDVRIIATNAGGKSDTCIFNIQLRDTISPRISDIALSPAILTVPDHRLHTIDLSYTVTDCSAVTNTISVSSNEPVYGLPDWEIVDGHTVKLRAKRNPLGNGRVYTITVTSADASGNVSTATAQVLVPGNKPWTQGEGLAVTALPNPTFHQFVVLMASKDPQPIALRVYNSSGMLVETRNNIAPNSTILLGGGYNAGIYYLEIIQGNKRQILKVMKLGH